MNRNILPILYIIMMTVWWSTMVFNVILDDREDQLCDLGELQYCDKQFINTEKHHISRRD